MLHQIALHRDTLSLVVKHCIISHNIEPVTGSSGLGHTGYDAPVNSLERRLLRRSIQLHPQLYRSMGLSYEHIKKCGSIVVAWTPEELAKLPGVVQENELAGDDDARLLSQQELRELEPALSHAALGGVLLPREAVVEPWLVPVAYANAAMSHGAQIHLSTRVVRGLLSMNCTN
jgi:glycerol-3-phosphate dehydrogenase